MPELLKKFHILNIILAIMAAVVGYGSYTMVRRAVTLKNEDRDIERRILEVKEKNAELEVLISELKTPEAVEREAKERLNLKLPGEEVVVVPWKKDQQIAATSSSLWNRIMAFFK